MQSELVAGDTLDFLTTVSGYPATDGWTLSFRLVPRSGAAAAIEFDAVAEGGDYRTQVGNGATATWAAGEYSWASWVEKVGIRYQVETGQVTILPNPETLAAGSDTRSQAQKAVEDLNAALATYTASSGHVSEYTIAGRSMKFRGVEDILVLLNHWQLALQREQAAASVAKGLANPRRYYLRFGRA